MHLRSITTTRLRTSDYQPLSHISTSLFSPSSISPSPSPQQLSCFDNPNSLRFRRPTFSFDPLAAVDSNIHADVILGANTRFHFSRIVACLLLVPQSTRSLYLPLNIASARHNPIHLPAPASSFDIAMPLRTPARSTSSCGPPFSPSASSSPGSRPRRALSSPPSRTSVPIPVYIERFLIDNSYTFLKPLTQHKYAIFVAARHNASGETCGITKVINIGSNVRPRSLLSIPRSTTGG